MEQILIENNREANPAIGAQKLQVLFVDTNPFHDLFDLLGEIEFSGATAAEAIHKISQKESLYDAVVVDATISSNEIRTLRRLTNEGNVPLILYTSFFDQKVKDKALQLKADDYVSGSVRYSIGSQIKLAKQARKYKIQWLKQENKFDRHAALEMWNFVRRRIVDIVVSVLALILFSPLLLILSTIQEIELMEQHMLSDTKNKQLVIRIFDWYQFLVLILFSPIFGIIKLPLKIIRGKFQSYAVESTSTRLDKIWMRATSARLVYLHHVLRGDISLFGAKSVPNLSPEMKQ